MNGKMLALYGLKWNPFTPNVPTEALHVSTRLESFCWRVQQLASEGGFALLTGAPGCGKSAALRILSAALTTQRDITVGVISRPQANIADFYREMGELLASSCARIIAGAVPRPCASAGRLTSNPPCPGQCFWSMRHRRCRPPCSPNCACWPPQTSTPTSC